VPCATGSARTDCDGARHVDAIGAPGCIHMQAYEGGSAVRNFLAGLLLGWFATYWYLTQGDYLRMVAWRMWVRASAPSGIARQVP